MDAPQPELAQGEELLQVCATGWSTGRLGDEPLDAACRARLLEELGEDAYGFVHDMIREL